MKSCQIPQQRCGNQLLITFLHSGLDKALKRSILFVPANATLPGTHTEALYVMVGGKAFSLETYLMRPYPGQDFDAYFDTYMILTIIDCVVPEGLLKTPLAYWLNNFEYVTRKLRKTRKCTPLSACNLYSA